MFEERDCSSSFQLATFQECNKEMVDCFNINLGSVFVLRMLRLQPPSTQAWLDYRIMKSFSYILSLSHTHLFIHGAL